MFLPRINALSYCIVSIENKRRAPISKDLSDINLGNNICRILSGRMIFGELIGIAFAKN